MINRYFLSLTEMRLWFAKMYPLSCPSGVEINIKKIVLRCMWKEPAPLKIVKFFFFYIYFNPWGARKGVHLANHNLISVRLRKYWLIILEYCTFLTSACSFNIGLALLLGIRSLDPRPRARTAPALAWCRRQLGSQTSCSAKSRSQFWSLTFNDKHWNVWWNLAS